MEAILENITTKFRRYYPDIEVISSDFIYTTIGLDTTDMIDGEYQLTLYDNGRIVGNELVRLGDYNVDKQEYKIEKKFTQYVRK